jgi:hypothetical protein
MKPIYIAGVAIVLIGAGISVALSMVDSHPDRFRERNALGKVGLRSNMYVGRCSLTTSEHEWEISRGGSPHVDLPDDCDLLPAYREAMSRDISWYSRDSYLPFAKYYPQNENVWHQMMLREYNCDQLGVASQYGPSPTEFIRSFQPMYDYIRGLQTSAIIRRKSKPYLNREYAKLLPAGVTRQPEKDGAP